VSSQLGLLVLIAVGMAAGTLFWFGHVAKEGVAPKAREKACENCGSAVLENWRLCPDCGRFIEPSVEQGEISPTGT
jgi:uncharacterized OB-fold protein